MKNINKFIVLITLLFSHQFYCQSIVLETPPELVAPNIISTKNSEIKITFSPDGKIALWGTIGWTDGTGEWDIWMSSKDDTGWTKAIPVSFNSTANDFDPCFSPDYQKVYFFSNREGGFGGDDIYYVEYDNSTNLFGHPVNMGKMFNTEKDEWGPSVSSDGQKFIYCTDGLGGKGKHDILIATRNDSDWNSPKLVKSLNFEDDDFDAVFLHDNETIIFTRKTVDKNEALLYISFLGQDGYKAPILLSDIINTYNTWNFGSAIDISDKRFIYFTSKIPDKSIGRADIYRIKYSLTN